jgi:tetratricopeptide (TPR) repeat protein
MVVPLFLPNFEERNLAVLGSGLFRGPRLVVDGEVRQPNNRKYVLLDNNKKVTVLCLRRKFLDPIPDVEIGQNTIEIIPPFRWYEHFWMSLSGILIYFNIPLGIVFGLGAYAINSRLFRSYHASWLKYYVSGIFSGVAVVGFIVAIIVYAFISKQLYVYKLEAELNAENIQEIHQSHTPYIPGALNNAGANVDQFGYPVASVDRLHLAELLAAHQFPQLTSELEALENGYEKDFRMEYQLAAGFDTFSINDSTLEATFTGWVSGFPESYVPLLARAVFFENLGWESRGYAWASETSAEKFERMREYFDRCEEDIQAALALKPNLMIAYRLLMRIANASSDYLMEEVSVNKAIDLCPYSVTPRATHMASLTPRWGGSYTAMDYFARDAEKYIDINPRLAVLRGYIAWDQGRVAEQKGDRQAALQLYTQALSKGSMVPFLSSREHLFRTMERYDDALADIRVGLSLDPYDSGLLKDLVDVQSAKGVDLEALDALSLLTRIDPKGSDAVSAKRRAAGGLVSQAYKLYKAKDYGGALTQYNRAMQYNPEHGETYYYRASTYLALGRYDESLSDARRAIELEPHRIDFYRYADYVLVQHQRWGEIISMWDRFLSQDPNNADAYLERSGAYFYKGDQQAALRDAELACKLGKQEGCAFAFRMKQRGVR